MTKMLTTILLFNIFTSCSVFQENKYNRSNSQANSFIDNEEINNRRGFESFEYNNTLNVFPKNYRKHQIKGICFVQNSSDTFRDYCQSIVLALVDQEGNQVAQTSTDKIGNFSFSSLKSGTFKLIIKDKDYTKVSNETFVSTGSEILIHLKRNK